MTDDVINAGRLPAMSREPPGSRGMAAAVARQPLPVARRWLLRGARGVRARTWILHHVEEAPSCPALV